MGGIIQGSSNVGNSSAKYPAVKVTESAGARVSVAIPIKTLNVPGELFNVMEGELTVEQFREFVDKTGYKVIKELGNDEILREGAFALHRIVKYGGRDEKNNHSFLTYLSAEDAIAFCNWRNKTTGSKFRLMTDDEWRRVKSKVGDQLTGDNFEWTSTPYKSYYNAPLTGKLVLRRLKNAYDENDVLPNYRFDFSAVRLVEDKK